MSDDLRVLIDLYWEGGLTGKQRLIVERAARRDEAFAAQLEERRRELDQESLDMLPPGELEEVRRELDERLKDICVQAERRAQELLEARRSAKTRLRLKLGVFFVSAAAFVMATCVSLKAPEITETEISQWDGSDSDSRRELYIESQRKRTEAMADMYRSGRGDVPASAAMIGAYEDFSRASGLSEDESRLAHYRERPSKLDPAGGRY